MSTPNAKICPRCHAVVSAQRGVCDHCGRLFRSPIAEPLHENKTMMFYNDSFPSLPPAVPVTLPRVLRLRRWIHRLRDRMQQFFGHVGGAH